MTEEELRALKKRRKTAEEKKVQVNTARSFFVEAMKETTAASFPRIPACLPHTPVLSPQGVVAVLRRQWLKMKPEEKAPYEEMEREHKSRQLAAMQSHFPKYARCGVTT